jgi:uncharacterized protein (DUF58 family)
VHPKTARLTGMTSGWIRDLEGRTTNDISTSDVTFHTLREYAPGDDRRHVHWKTSARVGTLMVRQFIDTRRSHLGLVLSGNTADYADGAEYELAISALGSLGLAALGDGQEVTAVSAGRPLPTYGATALLDALSGVEMHEHAPALHEVVRHAVPLVQSASVIAVVTGSAVTRAQLRGACERFNRDVRVVGIRAIPGARPAYYVAASSILFDLGNLDDLGRLLRATVSR